MKHLLLNTLVIVTMLFQSFPGDPASAKQAPAVPGSLSQAAPQTGIVPPVINTSDETGMVTFIGSADGTPIPVPGAHLTTLDSTEKASQVLQVYAPKFGINNPQQELILVKNEITDRDRNSLRYQQVYQGVPVMAGEIILNLSSAGDLYSMSGEVSPYLNLSILPHISAGQASSQALELMVSRYGVEQSRIVLTEPELWVFDERLLLASTKPAELVWRLEATTTDGNPLDVLILVNAVRGGISLQFNQVDTDVTGRTWLPGERQQEIPATEVPTETPLATETIEPTPTPLPTETISQDPGQVEPESTVETDAITTWYVATSGNDSNDCLTTTTPCASIQAAVDKAASDDTIYITTGTFTDIGELYNDCVVFTNKGIRLVGGWDLTFANQVGMTTLDGESIRRGMIISNFSAPFNVAIENFEVINGKGENGGGILIGNHTNVTLINNLIHNNTSTSSGGGIYSNYGDNVTIINSTIGENHAQYYGGGFDFWYTRNVSLRNTTIFNNSSGRGGGGIYFIGDGYFPYSATLQNTILAGNSDPQGPDCYIDTVSVVSNGYNLVEDTTRCNITPTIGDVIGQDPGLGFLLPSGVFFILPTSPVIDAGNPLTPGSGGGACEATDQLGSSRPIDGDIDSSAVCDIGAYETTPPTMPQAASINIKSGNMQKAGISNSFKLPLSVLVKDQYGAILPNVEVTFSSPTSGASASFSASGTNTTTAISGSNGVAVSSSLIANGNVGTFSITASVPGLDPLVFELENVVLIPSTVSVYAGSSQSTKVMQAFSNPLAAIVQDQIGDPFPGITVTFTAPGSGPSGIFSDTLNSSTTSISDSNGVATSTVFTANDHSGNYLVQATISGIATSANFQMQNRDSWYVSTLGSDSNDCITPISPCLSIQAVFKKAGDGDTIFVTSGIYQHTENNPFWIEKSITLRGGWDPSFSIQSGFSTLDGNGLFFIPVLSIMGNNKIVTVERIKAQNGRVGISGYYGSTTIRQSIITGNQTGVDSNGPLTIVNTTISGNSGSEGGGIRIMNGSLFINNSTITDNFATNSGGGIYVASSNGPITVQNSIIAGNNAGVVNANCIGPIVSGGHNIIGYGCSITPLSSDQANISDPQLTPLLSVGFHMPFPGSPAIDSGNPSTPGSTGTACETIDQTGSIRPVDGNGDGTALCDIGSAEFSGGGTIASYFFPYQGLLRNVSSNQLMTPPFGVVVLDENGKGVAGVSITFTAPTSGASGIFNESGTNSITKQTNGFGLATAGDFTANSTKGIYSVTATASGMEDPIIFTVTSLIKITTYTMNHQEDPPGSLPGNLLCTESKTVCTNGDDPDADHAQAYAIDTFQFYLLHHNRNSLDDNGMPLVSSVHYGTGYLNSFWDGTQAVFGDNQPSDDTVGHEFTHGVTESTSGLFYYYQSGAINESFSDLWGEFIDQTNGAGADYDLNRWELGEDGGAYRNMKTPSLSDQPDKMTSGDYHHGDQENLLDVPFDNGGVHTNSGVNNKAVYLMTDGDTFNGFTISGLGLKKVAAIYYEAQTHLLTSGSDYLDLYYALQQACLNVIGGPEGVTLANCSEVQKAIDAVEMNKEPVTNFMLEAQLCGIDTVPKNLFFDDFEIANSQWSYTNHNPANVLWGRALGYAASGRFSMYGLDASVTSDLTAVMAAGVTIPSSGSTYLYFQHAFGFDYGPSSDYIFRTWDGGVLEYKVDAGAWLDAGSLWDSGQGYNGKIFNYTGGTNPLAARSAFVRDSHGYVSSRYNLGIPALQGHNVKFRWRIGSDGSVGNLGWAVDNVRIYICQAPVPTFSLNVSKTGSGSGTITSSPVGINCGSTCSYSFDNNTKVTLTASASAGSAFTGWSGGGCTGTGTCTITITAATSITAAFELLPGTLNKLTPTTAAANQPLNVTLSWETSDGAASYSYCYDTTNDNACTSWVNNGSATSKSLSGLSPKTTYYWQVRATNAAGSTYANGSANAYWNFKTGALPGAFLKTSPTKGATNQKVNPTLKWAASTGAAFYEYCYDTSNDNACTNWVNNGTATSVVLTNLVPGTVHYWQVRAVSAVGMTYGNGSATSFWNFKTGALPGIFNKSNPVNGASSQPSSVTISWTASSAATSYWYCYDTTNDNTCTTWITNGTATSKALSGLAANTTYYWHVRADNTIGSTYSNGSSTAFWSFSTGEFVALPGAFNKTAPTTGTTGGSTNLTLSWGASTGAASYYYCYDKTNDNTCTSWINNGTATSVTLSGLSASTTYYWHIRATNSAGTTYSNASSTAFWNFKTGALPAAFVKSSPATGSTNKPLSLTLKWLASSGAASYWVCYDTTNDSACSGWVNNGTAISRVISALSPNTTYYWHVRADNAIGSTYSNSSSTAFWKFTTGTGGGTLPGAFNKSSPTNGATGQPTSPTLSWGASSGATSYWYCYDTTNDSACTSWVNNGTNTSASLTGLTASTTYYWHVRADNASGSSYSNASSTAFWSFATGTGGGTLPGSFNKLSPAKWATGVSTSVTLSWGASSDATSYQYCYDKINDNACTNWISVGSSTSVAISGLSTNTPYYWHVRAVNLTGTTYANGTSTSFWKFTTMQ